MKAAYEGSQFCKQKDSSTHCLLRPIFKDARVNQLYENAPKQDISRSKGDKLGSCCMTEGYTERDSAHYGASSPIPLLHIVEGQRRYDE